MTEREHGINTNRLSSNKPHHSRRKGIGVVLRFSNRCSVNIDHIYGANGVQVQQSDLIRSLEADHVFLAMLRSLRTTIREVVLEKGV